jgi:hypothetical protein
MVIRPEEKKNLLSGSPAISPVPSFQAAQALHRLIIRPISLKNNREIYSRKAAEEV